MKRLLSVVTILLFAMVAFANEPAHGGGAEGIPWAMITKQAINFSILVGLLVYLLGAKVKEFFVSRAKTFDGLLILAKKTKEDAERQKREISSRLERLQTTAQESVERARKEAEELRARIAADAVAAAKEIREEAKKSAEREIDRARKGIREEILAQSIAATRTSLKTSVKEPDQKRLQNEFVEKIQVVR